MNTRATTSLGVDDIVPVTWVSSNTVHHVCPRSPTHALLGLLPLDPKVPDNIIVELGKQDQLVHKDDS